MYSVGLFALVASEEWRVGSGEWRVGSGEWGVAGAFADAVGAG